jgi:nitroreductase
MVQPTLNATIYDRQTRHGIRTDELFVEKRVGVSIRGGWIQHLFADVRGPIVRSGMTTNPHLAVWDVKAADFPVGGRPAEQLRFLLRYAILAPSSHNVQPWLFAVRDNQVELRADRARGLRFLDPGNRQMTIGCGCALHHLLVAGQHFGLRLQCDILPNPEDQDLMARVIHEGDCVPDDDNEGLFEAIPRRRTNRQLFRDESLRHGMEHGLRDAAVAEGAWLHFLHDVRELEAIADLVADGDRRQWAEKRFRLELAAWTHPGESPSGDGIPGYAMADSDLLSVAGPMIIRTFDLGDGQAAKDRDVARYSPALAVMGTSGDGVTDWVKAGMALSRLLLFARQHGIDASFLNQPVEWADLREQLARRLGRRDHPQAILRMGYGPEVSPTPRRTVDEVSL